MRLVLPPTDYHLPKPTTHFLDAFQSLFQWDINSFLSDVDAAYNCWNQWAQQYLTLLSDHSFSRCCTLCKDRQTCHSNFPWITRFPPVLFLILVLIILVLLSNLLLAPSFLPFVLLELLIFGYHSYGIPLLNTVWKNSNRYSKNVGKLGNLGFVTLGRLIHKKIYQLVKGKFVEPFTCLQHEGNIVTDCKQIDRSLQEAWNPIFAKYPAGETKSDEYHAAFSLAPGSYPTSSFSRPTLDDLHYVST